jgi:hypothetical protein
VGVVGWPGNIVVSTASQARAVRQFEKAEVQALKPLLREILQLSTSTVSQPGFFLSRLFECSEQSLDLRGVARMR